MLAAALGRSKPRSSGPDAALAYFWRSTISNQRLLTCGDAGVTFRNKDDRRDGADRQRIMTLATGVVRKLCWQGAEPPFSWPMRRIITIDWRASRSGDHTLRRIQ